MTGEEGRTDRAAMSACVQAFHWSAALPGPSDTWPRSPAAAADIALSSLQSMFIAWGPDLTFLYDNAYIPIPTPKHPAALGRPFRQVWSEVWADLTPLNDRVT